METDMEEGRKRASLTWKKLGKNLEKTWRHKMRLAQATMIAREKLDILNIFKFLTFTRNPLCATIAHAKMREAE